MQFSLCHILTWCRTRVKMCQHYAHASTQARTYTPSRSQTQPTTRAYYTYNAETQFFLRTIEAAKIVATPLGLPCERQSVVLARAVVRDGRQRHVPTVFAVCQLSHGGERIVHPPNSCVVCTRRISLNYIDRKRHCTSACQAYAATKPTHGSVRARNTVRDRDGGELPVQV